MISVLAVVGLGYLAIWRLLPLQAAEWSNRWALWRAGVVSTKMTGELHAIEVNHCDPKAPPSSCTCIALIHGMADTAQTWKRLLVAPRSAWPSRVRIVAVDLPGAGETPPPATLNEYRVRLQAARVRSALAPMCATWVVVGNSFGGWVAAWLALDWREGVSRLVLSSSAGLREQVKTNQGLFEAPTVESLKDFQRRAYAHPRELPDHVWELAVQRVGETHTREIRAAQVPDDLLDDKLTTLRVPTTVIWGSADRVLSVESGRHLREAIRGALWKEVPDCGHLPQKECPQALIAAIGEMMTFGAM